MCHFKAISGLAGDRGQSSLKYNAIYSFNSLQFGDDPPNPFSFLNDKVWIEPEEQMVCHLTYTNERAHKIIAENMHLNRHVREEINGPRYNESMNALLTWLFDQLFFCGACA